MTSYLKFGTHCIKLPYIKKTQFKILLHRCEHILKQSSRVDLLNLIQVKDSIITIIMNCHLA